jgi:hypothetical protein
MDGTDSSLEHSPGKSSDALDRGTAPEVSGFKLRALSNYTKKLSGIDMNAYRGPRNACVTIGNIPSTCRDLDGGCVLFSGL